MRSPIEVIDLNQNGHGSDPFWTVAHVTRFASKTNALHDQNHLNHLNHRNWKGVCVSATRMACVCMCVRARACVRTCKGYLGWFMWFSDSDIGQVPENTRLFDIDIYGSDMVQIWFRLNSPAHSLPTHRNHWGFR